MATITVRLWGGGSYSVIKCYQNNNLIALIGSYVPISLSYNLGDTFKFEAFPGLGFEFNKFCQAGETNCITTNPFTGTVSGDGTVEAYLHWNGCNMPICSSGKLYESRYDNTLGTCIADTSNLVLDPCPTNYIEMDFTFLPQSLLNLMSDNITAFSDTLGPFLPHPSNITYRKTTYSGGKFRLYVNYTVPTSVNAIYDYKTIRNLSVDKQYETLYGAESLLIVFASVVVSTWIFLYLSRVTAFLGVAGIIASLGIALFIDVWMIQTGLWFVYDVLGQNEAVPPTTITPAQNLKASNGFAKGPGLQAINDLYPDCSANPPTNACDVGRMRGYVAAMGSFSLGLCYTARNIYPQEQCDFAKNKLIELDTNLANGTKTPVQAKQELMILVGQVDEIVARVQEIVNCPGQVWDVGQQKCVDTVKDCWIKNPLGGCALSAKTGKSIVLGAVLLGAGIIVYNRAVRK